jgi:SpoVK/Ycf46/Vps4 family AAA+-type ATPase
LQVQLDGAATRTSDFVLVIGATNRPQELDEAARRRFTKRIYVPLPDAVSRRALIQSLLRKEKHELSDEHVERVVAQSEGYSGADVNQLCREAAMGALRIGLTRHVVRVGGAFGGGVGELTKRDLPAITMDLFQQAFETVKPSVATSELTHYIKWNSEFGSEASKSALQTLAIMRPKPVKTGADDELDAIT